MEQIQQLLRDVSSKNRNTLLIPQHSLDAKKLIRRHRYRNKNGHECCGKGTPPPRPQHLPHPPASNKIATPQNRTKQNKIKQNTAQQKKKTQKMPQTHAHTYIRTCTKALEARRQCIDSQTIATTTQRLHHLILTYILTHRILTAYDTTPVSLKRDAKCANLSLILLIMSNV